MEPIIQFLLTGLTGFITFLLGIKRGKAETEGVLLQNLEKSVAIYQTIIEDMKQEIHFLNEKIDVLEKKVEQLLQENHELKKIMRQKDAVTHSKK